MIFASAFLINLQFLRAFSFASGQTRQACWPRGLKRIRVVNCSGVSGVVWAAGPAAGAKGCGVPPAAPLRRFCRALIKEIIVESACAAYSVGPCPRENQRSRSQTPPVPPVALVLCVVQIRTRWTT